MAAHAAGLLDVYARTLPSLQLPARLGCRHLPRYRAPAVLPRLRRHRVAPAGGYRYRLDWLLLRTYPRHLPFYRLATAGLLRGFDAGPPWHHTRREQRRLLPRWTFCLNVRLFGFALPCAWFATLIQHLYHRMRCAPVHIGGFTQRTERIPTVPDALTDSTAHACRTIIPVQRSSGLIDARTITRTGCTAPSWITVLPCNARTRPYAYAQRQPNLARCVGCWLPRLIWT